MDANSSINTYLSQYDYYMHRWEDSVGIVDAANLENDHEWDITRIAFVNGEIYGNPGEPPKSNISVAAFYLMGTAGTYEFVWWEIAPLSWALGWEGNYTGWFNNRDVPKSLEKKLCEAETRKVELKRL